MRVTRIIGNAIAKEHWELIVAKVCEHSSENLVAGTAWRRGIFVRLVRSASQREVKYT